MTLLAYRSTPIRVDGFEASPTRTDPESRPSPPVSLAPMPRRPADVSRARQVPGLAIRVIDDGGSPVDGAAVTVLPSTARIVDADIYDQSAVVDMRKTDRLGQVQLKRVQGTAAICVVSADGFQITSRTVSESAQATLVEIALARGSTVHGRVTLPDGSALASVHVVCVARGAVEDAPERGLLAIWNSWWLRVVADQEGRFQFSGVPPAEYLIRVSEDGWESAPVATTGESRQEAVIVASPIRAVRFLPVDATTGLPITVQGLGFDPRDPDVASPTRGGALTASRIFTPSGLIETTGAFVGGSITQSIRFKKAVTTDSIEVSLYWMSRDHIYLPVVARLPLRLPSQLLTEASVEQVRMRLREPEKWAPGLRVREAFADRRMASSHARFLMVEGQDGNAGTGCLGFPEADAWLFAPVPMGALRARVLVGDAATSDPIEVATTPNRIAEAQARFGRATGITLDIVNVQGERVRSVDNAYVSRLAAPAGAEVSQRDRLWITSQVQGLSEDYPPIVQVGNPGLYRVFANRGEVVASKEVEILEGSLIAVRLVLRSE